MPLIYSKDTIFTEFDHSVDLFCRMPILGYVTWIYFAEREIAIVFGKFFSMFEAKFLKIHVLMVKITDKNEGATHTFPLYVKVHMHFTEVVLWKLLI